jgi:hypothetical protein
MAFLSLSLSSLGEGARHGRCNGDGETGEAGRVWMGVRNSACVTSVVWQRVSLFRLRVASLVYPRGEMGGCSHVMISCS